MTEEIITIDGYKGEHVPSVLKAVKKHCIECSGYQRDEVKHCTVTKCYLWPFRLGKNPYRKKRELSEEQKIAMSNRMSEYWSSKEDEDDEDDSEE